MTVPINRSLTCYGYIHQITTRYRRLAASGIQTLNTVSTNGYKSTSGENKTIAPFSICKLMLLFKTIGPVNHTPAGTVNFPPPFYPKHQ